MRLLNGTAIVAATPAKYNGVNLVFSAEQVLRGGVKAIWVRAESEPSIGDIRVLRNMCGGFSAEILVDRNLLETLEFLPGNIVPVVEADAPYRAKDKMRRAVKLPATGVDGAYGGALSDAALIISDIRKSEAVDSITEMRRRRMALQNYCFFIAGDAAFAAECGTRGAEILALADELFFASDPVAAVRGYAAALAVSHASV